VSTNSPYRQILADNGISRPTASRWQELGRVDDEEFEARLAKVIADGESPAATRFARLEQDDRRERLREGNRELTLGIKPPKGPARTIVIDPPWDWGDEGDVDQFGRARPVYATQSTAEIAELPIRKIAEPDAHLYLWITNRSLPKGFGLLEAWGFRYVTCLTWAKPHYGLGNYYRGQTEHVLFGVRGSLPLLRNDVGTLLHADRAGEHSTKPDEFYALVEACSPGPWMDIYARRQRPGWLTWGAEA
jgi:N6-adenosine-specific RNA methylase IME4